MINQFLCRSLGPNRPSDGSLTAANLIDAIITHQINQSASEPPAILPRDGSRSSFVCILVFYFCYKIKANF